MQPRQILYFLFFSPALLAQTNRGADYRGGLVTPPLPKPRFVLADTAGRPFDFSRETKGYVTLLFFGYASCPDQCPMHLANLSAAFKRLPPGLADQVKFVFVTTDPARDTAQVLRHWLDLFDPRFVGLTGTGGAIAAVQRMAGVPLAQRSAAAAGGGYAVAHANFVLAYTKDDRAHIIYPGGVSSEDWVHDLPRLIHETWAGSMGGGQ